jgi:hypothetical protein
VFDEQEIELCYLTNEEAFMASVREHKTDQHPDYPAEAIRRIMKERYSHRYPHDGVLRFDRLRSDGEILHPYAGRKEGNTWMVDLYLPLQNTYDVMAELDFIALPRASKQDTRA